MRAATESGLLLREEDPFPESHKDQNSLTGWEGFDQKLVASYSERNYEGDQ